MKITAKKYAEALVAATNGKSEDEAKKLTNELARVMFENKDLKLADQVAKYFVKIWNKNNDITVVDVTTAQKLDTETQKELEEKIVSMLNVKKIEIREKIDKSIIGGVIVKHGDKIYDGSLKGRLYSLKEELVK